MRWFQIIAILCAATLGGYLVSKGLGAALLPSSPEDVFKDRLPPGVNRVCYTTSADGRQSVTFEREGRIYCMWYTGHEVLVMEITR